jgi:hypothetical protein
MERDDKILHTLLPEGIKKRHRGLKIAVWSPDRTLSSTVVLNTLWAKYGGVIANLKRRRCYLRLTHTPAKDKPHITTRIEPHQHVFAYCITTLEQLIHLRKQGYHLLKIDSMMIPRIPKPGILGVPVEKWKIARLESINQIYRQNDAFWDSIVMDSLPCGKFSRVVIDVVEKFVLENWNS